MTFRRQASGFHHAKMWLCAAAAMFGVLAMTAYSARGQCEAARLLPEDVEQEDLFGWSVAVDGDAVFLGAIWDDDNGADAGAVYLYQWDGTMWSEAAKLLASDGEAGDGFGCTMAVDGDVAVIGAPASDEADPEEPDCLSGSAYVFRFTDGDWVQEAKLLAPEPECGDYFGYNVAIAGDVIVIGARFYSDMADDAGAAYVYRYDGSAWAWEATLHDPEGAEEDCFGIRVDIFQSIVVVGAGGDDEGAEDTGSAFVFEHDGSDWILKQKLLASDGEENDYFGDDVAIWDDMVVVGAHGDDDLGFNAGSMYVFHHDGEQWTEEVKLLASDGGEYDKFGFPVVTNGSVIVTGAYNDDDNGSDAGAAYVFRKEGPDWVEQVKLLAADGQEGDQFGWWIAIDEERVAISAMMSDPPPPYGPGAGYVFELNGEDCNENGICDPRDILEGTSCDINANGIPDECEDLCTGDVNADGEVDAEDLNDLLGMWGPCPPEGPCMADFICDGVINVSDLLVLLAHWGPCPERLDARR